MLSTRRGFLANRYWENDDDVRANGCDPEITHDIARQLIRGDVGSRLHVILGGGRGEMRNATFADEEGSFGYRTDGLDLIQEYKDAKSQLRSKYVWNAVIINFQHNLPANCK